MMMKNKYGNYTAEYCRSTGKPMYQKEDWEKRAKLYSRTQCRKMGRPVQDGEEPAAFYRVLNGYCGLYEREESGNGILHQTAEPKTE